MRTIMKSQSIIVKDKEGSVETQVKEGYTMSKRGWIPIDWENLTIDQVVTLVTKGTTPPKGKGFVNKGINYIKSDAINYNGQIDVNKIVCIDVETHEKFKRSQIEENDILFSMAGELLGKNAIVPRSLTPANTNQALAIIRLNQHKAFPKFISYSLSTDSMIHYIKSVPGQSAQPNINFQEIRRLPIPLPPLPEQQKIARILSTWDKGITKLEQLISQKELLKKGLMQQLLTGKKRFAGFTEKWKRVTISDVFEFLSTNSFSRNDLSNDVKDGSVYNIHYGDIHATYHEPILDFDKCKSIPVLASDVFPPNKADFLQDGDLIIADASEDYEGVADSIELKNVKGKKVLAGLHTFALRDKSRLTENGFRTYLLKHPKVANALKSVATGSKVYGISKANILKVELIIPSNEEQNKIGEFFSVFDQEIAHLQNQLTQLQEQKKGLMQKLLTGEVRVKI